MTVADLHAQNSGSDEPVYEGLLRVSAADSRGGLPALELIVDEDHSYLLLVRSKSWAEDLQRLQGRILVVRGSLQEIRQQGKEIRALNVEHYALSRKITPQQKAHMDSKFAAQRDRYHADRQPLTGDEREAAVAKLAAADSLLDPDLKLRHTFTVINHHISSNHWQVEPDGTFEKFKRVRVPGRTHLIQRYVVARGQLTPRQLVHLAELAASQKLLELPPLLDDGVEIDAESQSSRQDAFTIAFGDFRCSGRHPAADSTDDERVRAEQVRLSRVANELISMATNNLRFQTTDR
jgi:hypothetical protein